MTQRTEQDKIAAAFQQIASIIRTETHNDATLFNVVAQSIQSHPAFAFVLATNIAEVLDNAAGDVQYHEVLVEAYRRTLFAKDGDDCAKFDMFAGDGDAALEFARVVCRLNGTTIAANVSQHLN